METYRGFQLRISNAGFLCRGREIEEPRMNGEMLINGEWKLVSPDAIDYQTIYKEFDAEISTMD